MNPKTIELHNLKLQLFQTNDMYSLMKKSIFQKEKTSILYCDFRLLNYSYKNLLSINNKNIFIYPDSSGVYIALKIFLRRSVTNFKKLISTDINIELLKLANEKNLSLFLFGSEDEVLRLFINRVSQNYPSIKIVGFKNGFGNINENVVDIINSCNPDILLVGLGVPKQELWVIEHFDQLNTNLIVTVGAFFSLYSGHVRRAPRILRSLSFEWLVRLINEPRRLWKRYFVEYPLFVINVIKERIAE